MSIPPRYDILDAISVFPPSSRTGKATSGKSGDDAGETERNGTQRNGVDSPAKRGNNNTNNKHSIFLPATPSSNGHPGLLCTVYLYLSERLQLAFLLSISGGSGNSGGG